MARFKPQRESFAGALGTQTPEAPTLEQPQAEPAAEPQETAPEVLDEEPATVPAPPTQQAPPTRDLPMTPRRAGPAPGVDVASTPGELTVKGRRWRCHHLGIGQAVVAADSGAEEAKAKFLRHSFPTESQDEAWIADNLKHVRAVEMRANFV